MARKSKKAPIPFSLTKRLTAELEFQSSAEFVVKALPFGHGWAVMLDGRQVALITRRARSGLVTQFMGLHGQDVISHVSGLSFIAERLVEEFA